MFFNAFHNIGQLGSSASMFRIQNGVFYRTKIIEQFPICGKISAGTYHFCLSRYLESTKHRFLRPNTKHAENTTCNMFTKTTICVGQICWLIFSGRRKFEHINYTFIVYCNLLSVCSIVGFAPNTSAACKVNVFHFLTYLPTKIFA